jgi:ABC-2 type transport system permease protein
MSGRYRPPSWLASAWIQTKLNYRRQWNRIVAGWMRAWKKKGQQAKPTRRQGTAGKSSMPLLPFVLAALLGVIYGPMLGLFAYSGTASIVAAAERAALPPDTLLVSFAFEDVEEAHERLRDLDRQRAEDPGDAERVASQRERVLDELREDLERSARYRSELRDPDAEGFVLGEAGRLEVERILAAVEDAPKVGRSGEEAFRGAMRDGLSWPEPGPARDAARNGFAALFFLLFVGFFGFGIGTAGKVGDLRDRYEALLAFPVSARGMLLAKWLEYVLSNLLAVIVLFAVAAWVASLRFGVGGALLVGLATAVVGTVGIASLQVVLEMVLPATMSRQRAGTVQALLLGLGSAALLVVFLVCQPGNGAAIADVLVRADAGLSWSPTSAAMWLVEAPGIAALGLAALVVALPLVATSFAASWMQRALLLSGAASRSAVAGRRVHAERGAQHLVGGEIGLMRKEVLQALRDRQYLVSLFLPGFLVAINFVVNRTLRDLLEGSAATRVTVAFGVSVYSLLVMVPRMITGEYGALWLLWSFPRSFVAMLRAKIGAMRVVALAYFTATVLLIGVLPTTLADFVRLVWCVVIILLTCEVLAGLFLCVGRIDTSPDAKSSARGKVGFVAGLWMQLFLVHSFGAVAYGPAWMRFAMGVQLLLVVLAVWQAAGRRLAYVLDPDAAPPSQLLLVHGLVATVAFFVVQNVAVGVGVALGDLEPIAALAIGYGIAALLVGAMLLVILDRAPPRDRVRWIPEQAKQGATLVATAVGMVLTSAVGVGYLTLLRDSEVFSKWMQEHPELVFTQGEHAGWVLLLAVGFAPWIEELLFRGLVHSGLRRSQGAAATIVLTALAFATVHPIASWVPVFVLGLVTGVARERTGALLAPILIHTMYNLVVLAVQLGWTS